MFVKFDKHPDDGKCWTIVDTDFIENQVANNWEAFFSVYEKRGLNVAANVALMFRHMKNEYNRIMWITIDVLVAENERNPLYSKYANDINKYLMLM